MKSFNLMQNCGNSGILNGAVRYSQFRVRVTILWNHLVLIDVIDTLMCRADWSKSTCLSSSGLPIWVEPRSYTSFSVTFCAINKFKPPYDSDCRVTVICVYYLVCFFTRWWWWYIKAGFSPEGYRMSRPTCVKNCPLFRDMLKNSRHAFSHDATSFFPAVSVVVHQSILTNLHRYFYCRYNGSLMSKSNSASVE